MINATELGLQWIDHKLNSYLAKAGVISFEAYRTNAEMIINNFSLCSF